jgi:hypothetical protein
MDAYCAKVIKLKRHFDGLEFHHVQHDSNVATDLLAKLRSDRALVPPGVFMEELLASSIKQPKPQVVVAPPQSTQILTITPSWTQVFIDFLKE